VIVKGAGVESSIGTSVVGDKTGSTCKGGGLEASEISLLTSCSVSLGFVTALFMGFVVVASRPVLAVDARASIAP